MDQLGSPIKGPGNDGSDEGGADGVNGAPGKVGMTPTSLMNDLQAIRSPLNLMMVLSSPLIISWDLRVKKELR